MNSDDAVVRYISMGQTPLSTRKTVLDRSRRLKSTQYYACYRATPPFTASPVPGRILATHHALCLICTPPESALSAPVLLVVPVNLPHRLVEISAVSSDGAKLKKTLLGITQLTRYSMIGQFIPNFLHAARTLQRSPTGCFWCLSELRRPRADLLRQLWAGHLVNPLSCCRSCRNTGTQHHEVLASDPAGHVRPP